MKYLIIALIGYALGCWYGYMKGYDDAKGCYTSFYNTILNKIYDYEKERTNVK